MCEEKCSKCGRMPVIFGELCIECSSDAWALIIEGNKTAGLSFCGVSPQPEKKE